MFNGEISFKELGEQLKTAPIGTKLVYYAVLNNPPEIVKNWIKVVNPRPTLTARRDGIHRFTNYWHAYACLRLMNKGGEK